MLNLDTANQIKKTLLEAERILAITHQKPDGDGLGALSALAGFLSFHKKDYRLFCLDPVPANYDFIPLLHRVSADQNLFSQIFDVVVVLDSGDLKYAGIEQLLPKLPAKFILINIDHHVTNPGYGDINMVMPDKSSVSEIMYNLLRQWQFPINKDIATALLNGIMFDTGAFSNAATGLSSLEAASHLLNLGARSKEINENQLRNKSVSLLKLWGRAFERLTYNPAYDLAFTVITQQDIAECQASQEASEGISNFLNELAGVKVALVLKEKEDGTIKGSLRTTFNDVDVSLLAKSFGGGGHKKAAAFSLPVTLIYQDNRWLAV